MKIFRYSNLLLVYTVGISFLAVTLTLVSLKDFIWFEELEETVRSVYFFSERLVYHEPNTNVGWYAQVLLLYRLFGFDLLIPRLYKLILFTLSGFSIYFLYRQYTQTRNKHEPLLPVLLYTLSPTVLYYVSHGTSMGFDLIIIPLLFYLLLIRINNINITFLFRLAGVIGFAMAALSYPTAVAYIPVIMIIIFIQYSNQPFLFFFRIAAVTILISSGILIFFINYIHNTEVLFAGAFRGGGALDKSYPLVFKDSQSILLLKNISGFYDDLFNSGKSYHFILPFPDFSLVYPRVVLLVTGLMYFYGILHKKAGYKLLIFLGLYSFLYLYISSFAPDITSQPGVRRFTPLFVFILIIISITWSWLYQNHRFNRNNTLILKSALMLLIMHHLTVLPINILYYRQILNGYIMPYNTISVANRPYDSSESILALLNQAVSGPIFLKCTEFKNQTTEPCRYDQMASLIHLNCQYNRKPCYDIYTYDQRKDQYYLWNPITQREIRKLKTKLETDIRNMMML